MSQVRDYEQAIARNEPFGRAVVTRVWGSAPRSQGAVMLATRSGFVLGSVSGGCVENAVTDEILAAMERGTPKLVTYGVSDETAWEVGLSCGGTISVFVEPMVREEVLQAMKSTEASVIATVLDGPAAGTAFVVCADGDMRGPLGASAGDSSRSGEFAAIREQVRRAASEALQDRVSREVQCLGPHESTISVMLEVFGQPPKLVVFGGVHIAQELTRLAHMFGYRTYVADGRAAWLTRERFPDADELVLGWPEEAFAQIGLDADTYVVLLSHDPKFDEPAMECALRSPARYIGAIGSRKTQHRRKERLRSLGFTDADLARLRGPIGLDLGGRQPLETALAILAEITAVRYGGTGRPMCEGGEA